MTNLIPTKYRFIYAAEDKPDEEFEVQWPKDPGYDLIKTVVEQMFPGHTSEHVYVLYNDQPCDMFVDEIGHGKNSPVTIKLLTSTELTGLNSIHKLTQKTCISSEVM